MSVSSVPQSDSVIYIHVSIIFQVWAECVRFFMLVFCYQDANLQKFCIAGIFFKLQLRWHLLREASLHPQTNVVFQSHSLFIIKTCFLFFKHILLSELYLHHDSVWFIDHCLCSSGVSIGFVRAGCFLYHMYHVSNIPDKEQVLSVCWINKTP